MFQNFKSEGLGFFLNNGILINQEFAGAYSSNNFSNTVSGDEGGGGEEEYTPQWSLSGYTNDEKELLTTIQVPYLYSFYFSPDGQYFFAQDLIGETVARYELTVPWDVSTGSHTGNIAIVPYSRTPNAIKFRDDGTFVYSLSSQYDAIYGYELLTPWDLSTIQAFESPNAKGFANDSSTMQAFDFNSDGTILVLGGDTTGSLYKYTMSPAWDLENCTLSQSKVSLTGSAILSLQFNSTGNELLILDGEDGGTLKLYYLSTPWDLSTITTPYETKTVTDPGSPKYALIGNDGANIYFADYDSADYIRQFSL